MKKILTFILMLIVHISYAQIAPVLYYDFDQLPNPLAPRVGTGAMTTSVYEKGPGAVGNCVSQLYQDSINYSQFTGPTLNVTTAASVQMLIKPGYFFLNNRKATLYRWGNNFVTINAPTYTNGNFVISFTTTNAGVANTLEYNLEYINRAAIGWLLDSAWHQLVFVHAASTGNKSIYIDGQKLIEAACPVGTITLNSDQRFKLNNNTNFDTYYGSYDEVALYSGVLTPSQVYKNYQDFQAGQHYTTAVSAPPSPASLVTGNDITDYPLGYTLGSPNSQNCTYTALEQLTKWANPRYPYSHTLRRNFNWVDLEYFGGRFQPGVINPQLQSYWIQKVLYQKYNYMLLVSGNITAGSTTAYSDTNTYQGKWVKLANENPTWQRSAISFWNQVPNRAIQSQSLPANYYIRNSTGTFILIGGRKLISPAAPLPGLINNDGVWNKSRLATIISALSPNRIDFVNENDEVWPLLDSSTLSQDPAIVAEKTSLGMDYRTYYGYKQRLFSVAYRDSFMAQTPSSLYTQYKIDGWDGSLGRNYYTSSYSQRRFINRTVAGRYYSTFDFYPRYPKNWRTWSAAWHGWQPFDESRQVERAQNDFIFSPFVSAGWNTIEEQNLRPGRWLGLLKCLGAYGVDFYYTGYFNEGTYSLANPPASPKGYAYQLASPAYAQAVLARYDTIVKTGNFIRNILAEPTVSTDTGYAAWAGDPRIWCVIRQDSLNSNHYIITASVQPNSNMTGQVPETVPAKVRINNAFVRFNAREQGSVYYYASDSAKFVQLDSWHERSHPDRWTDDITLQAEVADSSSRGRYYSFYGAKTYTTISNDYTNSYSALTALDTTERYYYNVYPKKTDAYKTYIFARSKPTGGYTKTFKYVYEHDGGTDSSTFTLNSDTTWRWYYLQDTVNLTLGNSYRSQLLLNRSGVEVDRVVITYADTTLSPSVITPCTTPKVKLVYTSPFCDTTVATVTATGINNYLWSNGQTSNSITISTSGRYSVTIKDNLGCSNDTSFNVIKQVAYVKAAYTNRFCDSTQVSATYPGLAGYLWSNGATTASTYYSNTGTVSVTVTDGLGCTADTAFSITKYVPYIRVSYTSPFCDSTLATTNVDAGNTYFWTTGQTTSSVYLKNSNFITVFVTDTNNCQNDTTFRGNKIKCDTCYVVRDFQCTSYARTRLTFQWTSTTAYVMAHEVYVQDALTGTITLRPASASVNYFRVTNLTPGRLYYVKMRSQCNVNGTVYFTDWTQTLQTATLP
jgi:hypothetical protein